MMPLLALALFGCGGSEGIETCGDPRVVSQILRGGGVERIEGYRVEVKEKGLCLHRAISGGREVPVYYAGGYYFVGMVFNSEGKPLYAPERKRK